MLNQHEITSDSGRAVVQASPVALSHTHTIIHEPTESLHWYKSYPRRHSQEDFSHLAWMSGRLRQYLISPLSSYTNHCLSLFKPRLSLVFKSFSLSGLLSLTFFSPLPLTSSPPLSLSLSPLLVWYNRRVLLHEPVILSGQEQECLTQEKKKSNTHPNKFTSHYSFQVYPFYFNSEKGKLSLRKAF